MVALLLAAAIAIAPDVHLVRGAFVPGRQPDGNTVILTTPDGLIVIDTGRHAAHTQQILDFARVSGRPVTAVINTHWHLDHTGGNARVRKAFPGARVHGSLAVREARKGFLARYRQQLEGRLAQAEGGAAEGTRAEIALIDSGRALEPDDPVKGSGARLVAGRSLRLGLEGPAATAGDVWVFDPATKTLVAGDLVTLPAPFLDTACPEGWKAALSRLAAVDFERLVPGHGAPMGRREFEAYRAAFDGLLACGASERAKESCIEGWVEATAGLTDAEPSFTRSLVGYYLDAHLRGDRVRQAALCEAGSGH